jgi:hypothetical protein
MSLHAQEPSETFKLALSDNRFSEVIAPTRKPLAPRDRLLNPATSRLEELTSVLTLYKPDAVICALAKHMAGIG